MWEGSSLSRELCDPRGRIANQRTTNHNEDEERTSEKKDAGRGGRKLGVFFEGTWVRGHCAALVGLGSTKNEDPQETHTTRTHSHARHSHPSPLSDN